MLPLILTIIFLASSVFLILSLINPRFGSLGRTQPLKRSHAIAPFLCLIIASFVGLAISNPNTPDNQTTLYAKTEITIYKCPEETCEKMETLSKGTSWQLPASNDEWLSVQTTKEEPGFIKSSLLTQEVPTTITFKKTGNVRSCPSFDCESLGTIPAEAEFSIFQENIQGEWYAIESKDSKANAKTQTVFVHKSIMEDKPSETQNKKSVALKAPEDTTQSGPPVRLHAKADSNIYKCASESCEVVDTIVLGSFYDLPYTPSKQWVSVNGQNGKPGFIKLSDLIKDLPPHCSLVLPYQVGYVSQLFIDKGFVKDTLIEITRKAEAQWEAALGRDLFVYTPGAGNEVNFTLGSYADMEPGHSGIAIYRGYQNRTVGRFTISVYNSIFDLLKDYRGPNLWELEYNSLYITTMHEMGHVIGLEHIPATGAIMNAGGASGQVPGVNQPYLTPEDINTLKNFCN